MTAQQPLPHDALAQFAFERLPSYFVSRYFTPGDPSRCLDWTAVMAAECRELKMLSTGELALVCIIADLEDRPGIVHDLQARLDVEHNVYSTTFTALLRRLDFELRLELLAVAHGLWLG